MTIAANTDDTGDVGDPRWLAPPADPVSPGCASNNAPYIAGPLSLSPPRPDPVPRSCGRVGFLDRQLAALLWY